MPATADIDAQVLEELQRSGHDVATIEDAVAATRDVYGVDEHNARLLLFGTVDTVDAACDVFAAPPL